MEVMVSFTPRPLYPRYPLGRRLVGPQSRCGHSGGEEKNLRHCTDWAIPAPQWLPGNEILHSSGASVPLKSYSLRRYRNELISTLW